MQRSGATNVPMRACRLITMTDSRWLSWVLISMLLVFLRLYNIYQAMGIFFRGSWLMLVIFKQATFIINKPDIRIVHCIFNILNYSDFECSCLEVNWKTQRVGLNAAVEFQIFGCVCVCEKDTHTHTNTHTHTRSRGQTGWEKERNQEKNREPRYRSAVRGAETTVKPSPWSSAQR